MFVLISSTNTSLQASISSATVTLQAALKNSSRSIAPTFLFRLKPIRFRSLLRVGSLKVLPAKILRKRRLCARVAAGLLRMSSSRSFFGSLVGYGGSATSLPGGKTFSLAGESGVALDGGEADAEEAGGLGLGPSTLDGLNSLLRQLFRIDSHSPMIGHRPI